MNHKRMDKFLLNKFSEVERLHWWWNGRRALLKLILEGSRPKKILDVGCGTGETLSYLQKLFPKAKLYGIDSSDKAIRFSKSRGHKNIILAKAEKIPFQDNFFDVVLLLDVLEHIKNHQKAIDEAKRVLRKGGKIIITSPGLSFIWSRHDTEQGHYRRYTRREIRKLALNAGLKTSFISYFNFFLSPPIIMIRLLSRLSMFETFANYDNSINFDIANFGILNSILKSIFVKEIQMLKLIKYPIGISISAMLTKK